MALATVLFGVVLVRTAWLCDDAYITLRTVDNFTHGFGLRWNIADRVQAYTHPLWMFLISSVYSFTEEPYYTALFLSIGVSTAAVALFLLKLAPPGRGVLLAATVLILSKAFVDYSTSGLENPLTHLLLVLFLWLFFQGVESGLGLLALSGVAALGTVNRLDTALLFAPAVALAWWKRPKIKGTLALLAGGIPLIAWTTFSLVYYGFPFPNTAYAKLSTGVPPSTLALQGIHYFVNSISMDPLTLLVIGAGMFLGWIQGGAAERAVALGVCFYLVYVIRVGGDFMSGRFFSAPLVFALALVVRSPLRFWKEWLPATTLVLFVGLSSPLCPVRTGGEYGNPELVLDNGIADERKIYYGWTGLLKHDWRVPVIQHKWGTEGAEFRARGDCFIPNRTGMGFLGYFSGPRVHILDQHGLTEPLLARLEVFDKEGWRIGHMVREVPRGYRETLEGGESRIADPDLAEYHELLGLITRGNLFDRKRWAAILRMNLGECNLLLGDYHRNRIQHLRAADVALPRPDGARWEDSGVKRISREALQVELDRTHFSNEMEISLDGNDVYRIDLVLRDTRIADFVIEPESGAPTGLVTRKLAVPAAARWRGFDSVRVVPLSGDERYSVGHLILKE
ncbi:MAG: hypothetical protein GHCLOJNM_00721 [bacterium]|nr:hypothetical protein [bacterium]